MREFIEMVEQSDDHMFQGKLTSIPIDDLPAYVADPV
jgi:hypothetical protein